MEPGLCAPNKRRGDALPLRIYGRKPTKHSSILKLFAETRDEDIVGRTSIAGGMHEGVRLPWAACRSVIMAPTCT